MIRLATLGLILALFPTIVLIDQQGDAAALGPVLTLRGN